MIQTLSTGECVNLTNPEGQRDNFPGWSPKGDWITFTSNREADQEYRIYLTYPARWEWAPQADRLAWRRACELVAGRKRDHLLQCADGL